MGVEVKTIKCPNCGASLPIEEGRKSIFCSYCGSKLQLHDSNEYTVNIRDEAEIEHAETERILTLKQMELEESRRAASNNMVTLATKLKIGLIAGGVLLVVIGEMLDFAMALPMIGLLLIVGGITLDLDAIGLTAGLDASESARVPDLYEYEKKTYTAVAAMFRGAGFKNVECVGQGDLTLGVLKRPGRIAKITINGKEITTGGKKYPKDAAVVIYYHSQA